MSERNVLIDQDKNRIEFSDVRYYLHPEDGNWYPSVTTILDAYPKSAQFFEWLKQNGDQADAIRDEAGENGSLVHYLTELYDNGETVSMVDSQSRVKYKQVVWSMFERYVAFCRRFNPEIIQNELHMVDPELGFGGTIDRIIRMDGQTLLMDIKTSGSLHKHYWLQLTAYARMYERKYGEKIDNLCILWLNAKTRTEGKKGSIQGVGWQLVFPDEGMEHYWRLFQCVKTLWEEENKDYRPRHLAYTLKHTKLKDWV